MGDSMEASAQPLVDELAMSSVECVGEVSDVRDVYAHVARSGRLAKDRLTSQSTPNITHGRDEADLAGLHEIKKLKVPGGLRRDYLVTQAEQQGLPPQDRPGAWSQDLVIRSPSLPLDDGLYSRVFRGSFMDTIGVHEAHYEALEDEGGISDNGLDHDGTEEKPFTHTIGAWQASFALFKALVGPGLLFLPSAVKNAGLISAIIISAVVGVVSTWCMLLMLDVTRVMRSRGLRVTSLGDVGAEALGPRGRGLINAVVVTTQMGVCTAYCVFIAENLQAFLFEVHGGMVGTAKEAKEGLACDLSGFVAEEELVYYIIAVAIPCLIPFTWVRQLKFFSGTNFVANMIILSSVLYMLVTYAMQLGDGEWGPYIQLAEPMGTMVYFGTAMYAFEGVSMLLPIQQCMAEPDKLPMVVTWTMGATCLLQVVSAAAAYLLYGKETQSIVTINLIKGSPLGGSLVIEVVQLAWILEVLFTFPLQLFPAAIIVEHTVGLRGRASGRKWTKNMIRVGLVLLVMGISLGGYRSVDNMVSLIGALGMVPLAIVFPAFFHYRIAYAGRASHSEQDLLQQTKQEMLLPAEAVPSRQGPAPIGSAFSDLLITAVGIVAALLAITLALKSWIYSDFTFQQCVQRT